MNCGYIMVIDFSIHNTRHLEGQGKHIRSEVVFMISFPGKGEAEHNAPRRDRQPPGRHPKLKENLREGRCGCQSWERKARSATGHSWRDLSQSKPTWHVGLTASSQWVRKKMHSFNTPIGLLFIEHQASCWRCPCHHYKNKSNLPTVQCVLTHTWHGTGGFQTWRAFEIKLLETAGNKWHLSNGTPRKQADIFSLCGHQKVGRSQGFCCSSSSQQEKTSGDSASSFSPFIHLISYARKLLLTFPQKPQSEARSHNLPIPKSHLQDALKEGWGGAEGEVGETEES